MISAGKTLLPPVSFPGCYDRVGTAPATGGAPAGNGVRPPLYDMTGSHFEMAPGPEMPGPLREPGRQAVLLLGDPSAFGQRVVPPVNLGLPHIERFPELNRAMSGMIASTPLKTYELLEQRLLGMLGEADQWPAWKTDALEGLFREPRHHGALLLGQLEILDLLLIRGSGPAGAFVPLARWMHPQILAVGQHHDISEDNRFFAVARRQLAHLETIALRDDDVRWPSIPAENGFGLVADQALELKAQMADERLDLEWMASYSNKSKEQKARIRLLIVLIERIEKLIGDFCRFEMATLPQQLEELVQEHGGRREWK